MELSFDKDKITNSKTLLHYMELQMMLRGNNAWKITNKHINELKGKEKEIEILLSEYDNISKDVLFYIIRCSSSVMIINNALEKVKFNELSDIFLLMCRFGNSALFIHLVNEYARRNDTLYRHVNIMPYLKICIRFRQESLFEAILKYYDYIHADTNDSFINIEELVEEACMYNSEFIKHIFECPFMNKKCIINIINKQIEKDKNYTIFSTRSSKYSDNMFKHILSLSVSNKISFDLDNILKFIENVASNIFIANNIQLNFGINIPIYMMFHFFRKFQLLNLNSTMICEISDINGYVLNLLIRSFVEDLKIMKKKQCEYKYYEQRIKSFKDMKFDRINNSSINVINVPGREDSDKFFNYFFKLYYVMIK